MDPQASRRSFITLFVVLLLDLVAFTCILPLYPSIFDYYAEHTSGFYNGTSQFLTTFRRFIGAPDVNRFNSVLLGGFLGSLFSLLQFLSCPLLGAFSDVYGRKVIFLLSVVGSFLSYLLWAYSTTFELFLLFRIFGGVCKVTVSLATAIVTDISTPMTRGKGMALIGVCFSIGFLVGPMTGAYFAKRARSFGPHAPFYVMPACFAATLTVLEAFVVYFFLPETLPKEKRIKSVRPVLRSTLDYVLPASLFQFRPLLRTLAPRDLKSVQQIGLVYFLYLFFYSGLEFTLTFLTHMRFHFESMQQGRMFLFIGLLMIAVQGGYGRRVKLHKQKAAALSGIVMIIPAFVIVGCAHTIPVLYAGLGLYAVGSGIVVPCLTTMISSFGSDSEKGTLLGVFRSLGALARALGPLAASAVFWCVGPTVTYAIGGLCLLLPFVLLKVATVDLKSA